MYFKNKEKWLVGNNIIFFLLHPFIRDLVVSKSRENNRDNIRQLKPGSILLMRRFQPDFEFLLCF